VIFVATFLARRNNSDRITVVKAKSMTAQAISIENIRTWTDGDLIVSSIAGRSDGFEELVRRYQRPITSYVFRMLGDYEASLDVTQEVFIKVYNSLSKYSSEYKFSTWLYRIAHNAAVDHMRRNSITPQSLEAENADGSYQIQLESRALSPEQDRERSEWRTEIEAVVRCLPPTYRDLILLRHSRDLSYDEIAEVTGLPLGTVKNRLFRARELMREMFIERGFTGV
jgi:RNA polymerase sigma-70 factor, ECF subfamily